MVPHAGLFLIARFIFSKLFAFGEAKTEALTDFLLQVRDALGLTRQVTELIARWTDLKDSAPDSAQLIRVRRPSA